MVLPVMPHEFTEWPEWQALAKRLNLPPRMLQCTIRIDWQNGTPVELDITSHASKNADHAAP